MSRKYPHPPTPEDVVPEDILRQDREEREETYRWQEDIKQRIERIEAQVRTAKHQRDRQRHE